MAHPATAYVGRICELIIVILKYVCQEIYLAFTRVCQLVILIAVSRKYDNQIYIEEA